jgi:hypothetical protein
MQWCKTRALEYVDEGKLLDAWNSMLIDMAKHPETANHPALELGEMMLIAGQLATADEMRKYIEGFR